MFTILAFAAVAILAFATGRANRGERTNVSSFDDDLVRQSVVFAREDLKLIAFLLAAILIALGALIDATTRT